MSTTPQSPPNPPVRLNFNALASLKSGDIVYEMANGRSIQFRVTREPRIRFDNTDRIAKRYMTFEAINVNLTSMNCEFYYHEKYPNFGPKLYRKG